MTTVMLYGGPWAGTVDIDHVVGPVFAVGHPIGNHYWLDVKSDPPAYHWDGHEAAVAASSVNNPSSLEF